MTFQLIETGKEYWEVARRYHTNRASGDIIKLAAVNHMLQLQATTNSQAVQKRLRKFISVHHAPSPIKPTDGGGPRYA